MTRLTGFAACCAFALTLRAATYTVEVQKSRTIAVPQATAAYAVDSAIADASAESGLVTVVGKTPGTTHVIVIAPGGVQALDVVVPQPPFNHPRGFVAPRLESSSEEAGYIESRYSSLPRQLSNQVDFAHHTPGVSTHFHAAATNFLLSPNDPLATFGQPRVALTSLFYEFTTPRRSVTLVDQYVEESPLTVDGVIVRGLHVRQDGWFFHGGYTSPAMFQDIFLPVQREGVFGTGYRFRLSRHSSLTSSVYRLTTSGLYQTGRAGTIGSLFYSYHPAEDFRMGAELGVGRGVGGAFDITYRRPGEDLHAKIRYAPRDFASLSISNLRGLYSDVSWRRQLTSKLSSDVNFSDNQYNLPNFQQTNVSAGLQLQYRLTRQWMVLGGTTYSRFELKSVDRPPIEALYFPVGLSFNTRHFGGAGQYQWSSYTGRDEGGREVRASIRAGFGNFRVNAFADRQTQAPTLDFLLSQVFGLKQALTEAGLTASTPQQITDFLRENAVLLNSGYLQNVTLNVTPVRLQMGGTATWQGRGRQPQISYEYLYNNDQTINSSIQIAIHRVSYTQRLTATTDLSSSWAQYRTRVPGRAAQVDPLYSLSMRHQFATVPPFMILDRRGTIAGKVFQDATGDGTYRQGMPGIPGAEVILDDTQKTRSASDGGYRFPHVSAGKHRVQVVLHSTQPYYFTTPAQIDADQDTQANFGVAYSLSTLGGQVVSDSGRAISGVAVTAIQGNQRFTATSSGDGRFMFVRMQEGVCDVSIDTDSLPAGYSAEIQSAQRVTLSAALPGNLIFRVRALRSVSGQVVIYDPARGQQVRVVGGEVTLRELGRVSVTDQSGRFLFRDLPSGTFVVAITHGGKSVNQLVTVPAEPSQQSNVILYLPRR